MEAGYDMKVATSTKSVSAKGIVSLAPLFTLAILLLYPWAFSKSEVDAELLFERHEDVRIQIEQIPETLGHWIKYEDIEIPTWGIENPESKCAHEPHLPEDRCWRLHLCNRNGDPLQ